MEQECCSFRDPEPRLAGAAYTKFLLLLSIGEVTDRDTVLRGEASICGQALGGLPSGL